MTKLVNIVLHGKAITCLKHPITRNMDKVYLTTDDIKLILQNSNATVREIFPDGSVMDLTVENCERADLFEVFKQEKQAKSDAKKAADVAEAKLQADIQARREARSKAIRSLLNVRNSNINDIAKAQSDAAQTNATNSAVEAAREQIEANKNL